MRNNRFCELYANGIFIYSVNVLCRSAFLSPLFEMECWMASSRARRLLIEIAILVAAVGFFPGVAGYAWAVGWLPVYGAVCHFDKIFGPAINPDGYRIYLLGRGCDIDAAIRNILAASQFAAGRDRVDADKIVAIYHHKQLPAAGNESLASDFVQQKLGEFATSTPAVNVCAPDNRYCTGPQASDEDFFSKWAHAYLSYVQLQFGYTAIDGADYIASLLRMGVVAQVIIALCYLSATLLATERIVNYIIRRSAVSQ